jgi:hypothetical protein
MAAGSHLCTGRLIVQFVVDTVHPHFSDRIMSPADNESNRLQRAIGGVFVIHLWELHLTHDACIEGRNGGG